MNNLSITIPYPPISWKRPGQSGNQRYDTQKHLKSTIAIFFHQAMKSSPPFSGAISINMTFFFKASPRVSTPKKIHMISRPDIDNLAKFYLDAMNEIIYKDDSQVIDLHLQKKYLNSIKQSDSYVYIEVFNEAYVTQEPPCKMEKERKPTKEPLGK